jgi:hypothetical protein
MSVLYHEPRSPQQVRFERLLFLLLVATAVLLALVVFRTDRGEPARGEIYSEIRCEERREVLMRLEEDAANLGAGALFCIHIDQLTNNEETTE